LSHIADPMEGLPDRGLASLRWAYALVDGLAAAGVRRAVISPGSRSTPLVLACDRHPMIHTRVHLDERAAAFLALGQGRAERIPTLVIATSGSAPAHWYPALLEASLSYVPMLLLSADRPPELQDWGANQTLDQQRLFGPHVRAFHALGPPQNRPEALRQVRLLGVKAVEQSLWPRPGPVHINLPFPEPLVPQAPVCEWPRHTGAPFPLQPPALEPPTALLEAAAQHMARGPGLVVCGPGRLDPELPAAVTDLARGLDAPILADPLCGLRWGPWPKDRIITRYDAFLRAPAPPLPAPAWVLRLGAAPISKAANAYLEGLDCPQILIAPQGDWPDPGQRSSLLLRADPTRCCRALAGCLGNAATSDAGPWRAAEAAAAPDLAPEQADGRPFEGLVVSELIATLPAGATLFSGNSLAIRQIDTWSGTREGSLSVLCNRGASGIDGACSTLLGLAASAPSPVVGLLGDLTLLHDLTGLLAAREHKAVILVLDNGGGGIFGHLPQGRLPDFERYWLTPQGLDLARVADLLGLGFQRVERQQGFRPAVLEALAAPGSQLVVVQIDRDYSLARHRAYWGRWTN
jgi:2-succinyl-5-enolpyruvyl-6-hydroxy-3-cyclohexene-1-carboxylate synthase